MGSELAVSMCELCAIAEVASSLLELCNQEAELKRQHSSGSARAAAHGITVTPDC